MHNNSWSLVLFTLLSQACAGIMIFFAATFFIDQQTFQAIPRGFNFLAPGFLALLIMAIAVLLSFLHLGKPLHAVNAVNHLSSSWLSREIFAVLIFGISVLSVFLIRMVEPSQEWLIPASLIFSAISGIFLVTSISKVYLIKTIPSWNSWYTPTSFFLSALILGSAATVLLFFSNLGILETGFITPTLIFSLSWALSILLSIETIVTLIFHAKLLRKSPAGIERISFNTGKYNTLHLIRIFILFVALFFTLYFIFRLPGISDNFQAHIRFFAMIFSLLVIEETIGRSQFYASYYRIGV